MDFKIFEKQLIKTYSLSDCKFALDDCKMIFLEYFKEYQVFTGKEHPPLRTSKLIELLNVIDGDGLFEPTDYPYLIESYFNTAFKGCDYNICHFFSGRVRELRFFETCY